MGPDVPRMTLRDVVVRIALVLFGLGVALALMEGGLRATSQASDNFWQPDPVLGHFHIPEQTGFWRSTCFDVPVRISSQGFRDREYAREKGTGTYRVVVLGDSMTEGLQVRAEETYPKVLDQRLKDAFPGRNVEVINLGVSGYGTAQQYLLLKDRGLQLRPDLVVLPVFSINDVRESSLQLEGRGDKPYLYFDQSHHLVLRPFRYPPPYYELKRFVRSLHTYRFFGARFARLDVAREFLLWTGIGTQINPELDREGRGKASTDIPYDLQIYLKEYPPEWEQAWEVVSALVQQTKHEVEQSGAQLLLVGLPSALEVVGEDQVRKEYPAFGADRFSTDSPYRKLEAIARTQEVRYLSLVEAFRAEIRSKRNLDDLYYSCDLHFAPQGHRLIAHELVRAVGPLLSTVN
jgi:lysophospholipase L1-like esterase